VPIDLPWLLPAPADVRGRIKAIRTDASTDARDLVALARFGLDGNQLGQLGKAIAARRDDLGTSTLRPVRLAIAATHTLDLMVEALPGTGLRHGVLIDLYQADYGQNAQAVLDPGSALYAFAPDLVWLGFDPQAMGLASPRLDAEGGESAVRSALDYVLSLRDAVRANSGAGVVLQTLPTPPVGLFGSFDACQPGSVRWMVQRFNALLASEGPQAGDVLFDLAATAELVGLSRWHDPGRWHEAKLPFALDAVPLAADHLCRVLAATRGLSRKCLVLDLDNTLWGGVIGDDGVEGIKLGQGSAVGEAFTAIQSYARDLRARGIILAVCSKNEEANALLPFRGHDEMVLSEDDIAVFVANWTDKASNLKYIAQTLNIGTDALVFLDDNPAERERVRQELPEVAVPEVGADPALYVGLLAGAGYFEAIAFGDEDRQRAAMYQANAKRTSELQKIGNMDEYLRSLDMVCTIRPFDGLGRARTAQLINKSNQFNLTTRRYTEADVAAMESDPAKFTMQVRLVDRFGDNGMISVVVFDRGAEEWLCDTWLMSCRVLGRRVEEAVLAEAAAAARAAGAKRLVGDYLPTPKNGLVEKHYEKLGFTLAGTLEGGGTRWVLDLADYQAPDLPMVIEHVADLAEAQA